MCSAANRISLVPPGLKTLLVEFTLRDEQIEISTWPSPSDGYAEGFFTNPAQGRIQPPTQRQRSLP